MGYAVDHVVESFAGGVLTFLQDVVSATPEVNHHVWYSLRPETPSDFQALFPANVTWTYLGQWGRSPGVRDLVVAGKLVYALWSRKNIIHAHSSKAGAVIRGLRAIRLLDATILYTPHGWSFQRTINTRLEQRLYLSLERFLGRYSINLAASEHERETGTAAGIAMTGPALHKPVHVLDKGGFQLRNGICTVGRLDRAKDPDAFLHLISSIDHQIPAATWIGGMGELANIYERKLASAGITITGWLTRESAIDLVSRFKGNCLGAQAHAKKASAIVDADKSAVCLLARLPGMSR